MLASNVIKLLVVMIIKIMKRHILFYTIIIYYRVEQPRRFRARFHTRLARSRLTTSQGHRRTRGLVVSDLQESTSDAIRDLLSDTGQHSMARWYRVTKRHDTTAPYDTAIRGTIPSGAHIFRRARAGATISRRWASPSSPRRVRRVGADDTQFPP